MREVRERMRKGGRESVENQKKRERERAQLVKLTGAEAR